MSNTIKLLFRDVEEHIPDDIKKTLNLIEEIIEVSDENIEKVFKDVEAGEVSMNTIYKVIEYALNIRFNHTQSLVSLLDLLSKKYGYEYDDELSDRVYSILINQKLIEADESDWAYTLYSMKEIIDVFPEDSPEFSIIHDDVDTFIKKSSEASFNAKEMIKINSNSPLYYVKETTKVSYLQAIAYFGAVKCFKYAILSGYFELNNVEDYAVAVVNIEIIHMLEQKGLSFDKCLEVSIKFHRHDVSDWLVLHYKCKDSSLYNSFKCYNHRAFFFKILNESGKDFLHYVAVKGYIDILKYLVEEYHYNVETKDVFGYTPLHLASSIGNFEIVKYLVEECHCAVNTKSNNGLTPLKLAGDKRHMSIYKYLRKKVFNKGIQ